MASRSLSCPLMLPARPASGRTTSHNALDTNNREVEVWVRDVNGMTYPVTMPISSRFADVMQKVRQEHGHFQFGQGIVGFEGGRNEFTTIFQMLPAVRPDNEKRYFRDNPIQPKFKVRRV